MALQVSAYGLSDKGRLRDKNEDAMAVEPSGAVIMVADGMGGAPAGEVASSLAVQEVCRGFHEGQGVREAILRANRRVMEMASSGEDLAGMGTTLTALRMDVGTGSFELGHVGDSRAYRLNGDRFSQLTRDQTVVEEMVEAGTLSRSEARDHYLGHILSQALGTQPSPEVQVLLGVAEEGDRFLLCTDGLVRVMEDEDLEGWVLRSREEDLEDLVQAWVEEANRRGAPDNVTIALLAVDGTA